MAISGERERGGVRLLLPPCDLSDTVCLWRGINEESMGSGRRRVSGWLTSKHSSFARRGLMRVDVAMSSEHEEVTEAAAMTSLSRSVDAGGEGRRVDVFAGDVNGRMVVRSIGTYFLTGLLTEGIELVSIQPPNLVLVSPGDGGAVEGRVFF